MSSGRTPPLFCVSNFSAIRSALSARRNLIRTWDFIRLQCRPCDLRRTSHPSGLRPWKFKSYDSAYGPWHTCAPENRQYPTLVHSEGSQIVWLSPKEEQLFLVRPTPCWLSIEATQSLPAAGKKERVRTERIKSDGFEPTPIPASVPTLSFFPATGRD